MYAHATLSLSLFFSLSYKSYLSFGCVSLYICAILYIYRYICGIPHITDLRSVDRNNLANVKPSNRRQVQKRNGSKYRQNYLRPTCALYAGFRDTGKRISCPTLVARNFAWFVFALYEWTSMVGIVASIGQSTVNFQLIVTVYKGNKIRSPI